MSFPRGRHPTFWTCLMLLPYVAAPAVGQQRESLDEGVFRIYLAGQEVGTETFSIRQTDSGPGAVFMAHGSIVMTTPRGTEEISTVLRLTSALRPSGYELRLSGPEPQRVLGELRGNRLTVQIISPVGERMREYIAAEGAALVESGVAHHYHFLAMRLDAAPYQAQLIIPREHRQVSARVSVADPEQIVIDGRSITARRMVVHPTGEEERRVWVDAGGRVLRVEIPARGYEARRVTLPR